MSSPPATPESLRQFTLWALDALACEVREEGGVYRAELPDDRRELRFTFDPQVARDAVNGAVELVDAAGPLVSRLARGLAEEESLWHARPAGDVRGVHEVTGRLFRAYTIEGGNVHLGGCSLEDRPFVRLTYRDGAAGAESEPLRHVCFDADGRPLTDADVAQRGLADLTACDDLPRHDEGAIARLVDKARSQCDEAPLAVAVVWCKYAEGKLQFTIGEGTAELPFAGWARTLEAPPFICRASGRESFHLAATDDGRVTVADALETCAATGRRVLAEDLVTCAATGRRVLPETTVVCPVSGQPVLPEGLVACSVCGQQVSGPAVTKGVCDACRAPAAVTKDDPRMARLLGEYPGLDRWRNWRLAETGSVYIAVARALVKQLLVVVDRETLELHRLATGSRLGRGWTTVTEPLHDEFLR